MTFELILPGPARRVVARANHGVPALLVDLLVTAVAEASVLWGVLASEQSEGHGWSWWVWIWALALPLALLWRRPAPFTVFWIVGGGTVVLSFLAYYAITWNHSCQFMLLVAMATVAYYRDGWRFWLAAATSVGATFLMLDQSVGRDMVAALIIALAFVAGRLAAQQRGLARLMAERMREAESAILARTAQAAAEERTRIARDMHDILAHAVSLMIVQAEAGAAVVHQDTEKAETSFDAIADSGRDALTQLRRMLGVLREDDSLALSPQPKIAELPRLVETVRATMIDVRMVAFGEPCRLPQDTEVAIYRTAQEALTNMVKHSRADRAELRLDWTPEALTLRVTDDGVGPRVGAPDSGRGLIGIRERITSCGGTVHAGAGPDGRGFQVLVRIPIS
jgi:signal transduction histidine kinase